MKKSIKELTGKNAIELEKEAITLRNEIAKLHLETKANPPKDTNIVFKKSKRLAQILTVLHATNK